MGFGMIFGDLEFWGELQRRGAHVKTLEIGSRGDVFCFWGNIGFYAELRRESGLGLAVFERFGRCSAWVVGGGGALCVALLCFWCWFR
jgi:hypothetical protein